MAAMVNVHVVVTVIAQDRLASDARGGHAWHDDSIHRRQCPGSNEANSAGKRVEGNVQQHEICTAVRNPCYIYHQNDL